MQIYFLGTGTSQGIPVIGSHHSVCLSNNPKDKRLRVSVWIKTEKASIVIDCGPDFRQQMLVSNCQKIDAILRSKEEKEFLISSMLIDNQDFDRKIIPEHLL